MTVCQKIMNCSCFYSMGVIPEQKKLIFCLHVNAHRTCTCYLVWQNGYVKTLLNDHGTLKSKLCPYFQGMPVQCPYPPMMSFKSACTS